MKAKQILWMGTLFSVCYLLVSGSAGALPKCLSAPADLQRLQ